jgi:Mg/Co/Ni transporter MgtE
MKFFKTTYQTCDDELISDLTYQLEFLKTFEMESYDEQSINTQLDVFYQKIKNNAEVMTILSDEKKKNHIINMSNEQSIFLLFSWDNLHRLSDLMASL